MGARREHAGEIEGSRQDANYVHWLVNDGELVVPQTVEGEVGGNVGERRVLLAERQQMAYLCGLPGETLCLAVDVAVCNPYQPPRVLKRQWTQQQCIHDTKDGGAGSDAQADDKNGERRET